MCYYGYFVVVVASFAFQLSILESLVYPWAGWWIQWTQVEPFITSLSNIAMLVDLYPWKLYIWYVIYEWVLGSPLPPCVMGLTWTSIRSVLVQVDPPRPVYRTISAQFTIEQETEIHCLYNNESIQIPQSKSHWPYIFCNKALFYCKRNMISYFLAAVSI